jgi:hypothetical protein
MKKRFLLLLSLILTGCSSIPLDLSFLNRPTAPPTVVNSPEPTVTRIVTKEPTDTADPFSITSKTQTATPNPQTPFASPTKTLTATVTKRPTITLEPVDPSLFTPSPNIFQFVQRSTDQLVWGTTCAGDRSIMFVVTVTPVRRLRYVLLFIRLQDKYSGRGTEWGAGAIMKDNDQGKYFYKLELEQIEDYQKFQDAWMQYQFVATTAGLTVLGRSVVDRTSVSVSHCSAVYP